jgi:DNA-binding NarL/FixJ family response regulator
MASMPLRVIIVDDNREVLSAVGRIIDQQVDMELIGVASVLMRALRWCAGGTRMSSSLTSICPMGGPRAANEMVVVAPGARLIAFSAFDTTLIRRAMTAAGVSASVSKSGDMRELLDAMRAGVTSPS